MSVEVVWPTGAVFLLAFLLSSLQVCEIIESPLFLKLNPMTKHTDVSFSFGVVYIIIIN